MLEQNKTKKIPYGVSDLLIKLTQNAMNIFNGKDICQALLPVALLCMMLTACSEETSDNNTPPTSPKSIATLTAVQPGSGMSSTGNSRIGFDSTGTGYWHEKDTIGVWSDEDGKFMPFILTSGAGEAKATFTGEITGTLEHNAIAVYPYSDKLGYFIDEQENSATVQTCLPSTYTYDGVDTDYSSKEGKSFNMLMLGLVALNSKDDTRTVEFYHYGSLLALKVDSLPSTEGTVTVSAGGSICGTVEYFEGASKGTRYAADAGNEVTFLYSNATKGKPGIFYVPLLAGDYEVAVKVRGKDSDEKFAEAFEKFSVERAHIKPIATSLSDHRDCSTTIDGRNLIDLGLSVLWAECNVGADLPADVGNYYSWGETSTKETYTKATSKYQKYNSSYDTYPFTKYTTDDKKYILESSDDAATVNWGTSWRMPTSDEVQELIDSCTCETATLTNSDGNEVTCYKMTSNRNRNCIYIPCSGYKDGSSISGSAAMFWSSSIGHSSRYDSYIVSVGTAFNSGKLDTGYQDRYRGIPVRSVREKTAQ